MSAIGPGYLEFVGASHSGAFVAGEVYLCERIVLARGRCKSGHKIEAGLIIRNVAAPLLGGWCSDPSHWKPIYRPRKGAFDHLLAPQDIKVDA